jgi:hypothetical protein
VGRGSPADVTGLLGGRGGVGTDAHRRLQSYERVPPGSPNGGSGDGAPARAVLKWRFKFLSPDRAHRCGSGSET